MTIDLTRRDTLVVAAGALASLAVAPGQANEVGARHGMSAFGDLKYPADFKHFDYVDPRAPKGGMFSHVGSTRAFNQNFLTFNSLNSFILRGDGAQGMQLTFASLMVRAQDEPDAMYGLAARAVEISPDGLTYRFLMRPGIKFHDGTELTAHDVAFSLQILKDKGHPIAQQLLRDFAGADAVADDTVVVRFAPQRGRDVPLFVAGCPIFSRSYYSNRAFDETTLEVPLGCGPYKVGRFEAGRYIEYERVKDWWGADLPVSRGQHNFDAVRYEYYRDRDVAFEGFTGKSYLFREEFTSRIWATRYISPRSARAASSATSSPIRRPRARKAGFSIPAATSSRTSGCAKRHLRLRFRMDQQEPHVRVLERTHSVFQNSNMMAVGKPGPDELALLEPFRGKVSDEVFGEPFVPPVSDGRARIAPCCARRARCCKRPATSSRTASGCRRKVNGSASSSCSTSRPSAAPHDVHQKSRHTRHRGQPTHGRSGAVPQADRRFRFDLVVQRFGFSSTPGNPLASYFSSQAAALKGSQTAGISDPVIDALIDKIIAADIGRPGDRLQGARPGDPCRPLLDTALVQGHPLARILDVFGRPAKKPRYARGTPETWWYDRDKAARLQRG